MNALRTVGYEAVWQEDNAAAELWSWKMRIGELHPEVIGADPGNLGAMPKVPDTIPCVNS